jgi:hypothetical protein
MKKMKLVLFFVLCLLLSISATPIISLVKSFPYNNDGVFNYLEKWDSEESSYGGPLFLGFASNDIIVLGASAKQQVEVYQISSGNKIGQLETDWYTFTNSVNSILVGSTQNQQLLWEVDKPVSASSVWRIMLDPKDYTSLPSGPMGRTPYRTGNMLFEGITDHISSWEFLSNGRYVYRQPQETLEWLHAEGDKLGFEYCVKNNSRFYFGENSVVFTSVYSQLLELGRYWNWPKDGSLDGLSERPNFHSLGVDAKGIGYAYIDNKLGKEKYSEDNTLWSPFRTVLIFDPWIMKITYRNIPQDAYRILMISNENNDMIGPSIGGRYEMQAHPSGDIYMFSANKKDQAYDLNHMKNDWWAELGADKRVIGRILGNKIPLRAEPNNTASIVDYNFENEYVWIQEESKKTTEYEGKKTNWVKIQKLKGTIGWMPKQPIILPE